MNPTQAVFHRIEKRISRMIGKGYRSPPPNPIRGFEQPRDRGCALCQDQWECTKTVQVCGAPNYTSYRHRKLRKVTILG